MSAAAPELITTTEALEALEPAWWELWRRSPAATPFQSPAWLLPWWQAFSPGRLACLALWRGRDLVALAPLYRHEDEHGDRLLPVGISLSDYVDVLVDGANPEPLDALAEALAEIPPRKVQWPDLRPEATALKLPLPEGWREQRHPGEPCPVLPLAGDDGMAYVPALQRRKWRMAGHRADRRGGCGFEPLTGGGEQTFIAELSRLHGERRRAQGEAGLFQDERVASFLRSALPKLLSADLADGSLLRFGEEVAGVYLGLQDHQRAYAWCGGFSHRFSRESPGTLLLGRAISEAAARGATEFHFLRGDEPYKRTWGAVDRVNTFRELARA